MVQVSAAKRRRLSKATKATARETAESTAQNAAGTVEEAGAPKKIEAGGVAIQSSDELIEEARVYLNEWKNRANSSWKFKKAKQVWILRWMYRSDIVDKAMFNLTVGYLDGMQGLVRQRTLDEARALVEKDTTFYQQEATRAKEDGAGEEEGKDAGNSSNDAAIDNPDGDSGTGDSEKLSKELEKKLRRNRYKRALKVAKALS